MSSDLLEAADNETAQHTQARRTRLAGTPAKLILESLLIVLSVLLALALSEWRERVAERNLAHAAVANFRREIEANLAALERVEPKHRQFAARLDTAATRPGTAKTAFDVFVATMPQGGLDTPPLGEAAWEVATSTGALRLLDYNVAAQLSETYLVQRSTVQPTLRLLTDRVAAPGTFDPASRETMVRAHQMLITELAGQEAFLIDTYRTTLKVLPDSARQR